MSIDRVLASLLEEADHPGEKTHTLIFVLGDEARNRIEKAGSSKHAALSSIEAVVRSRKSIDVIFLNRLQYLFMYLMKFEAAENSSSIKYNNFVIYGLDALIRQMDSNMHTITQDQVKLSNLIFDAAFRIKRKHFIRGATFVSFKEGDGLSNDLNNLRQYWEMIC